MVWTGDKYLGTDMINRVNHIEKNWKCHDNFQGSERKIACGSQMEA
jgi:hypothetical protein